MKNPLANHISTLGVITTFVFPIIALITGSGFMVAVGIALVGLLLMTVAHFMGVDEE
jgi:hypothetical protein